MLINKMKRTYQFENVADPGDLGVKIKEIEKKRNKNKNRYMLEFCKNTKRTIDYEVIGDTNYSQNFLMRTIIYTAI